MIWKKLLNEREIYVRSKLDSLEEKKTDPASASHRYEFSAALAIRASQQRAKKSITDYRLYPRMIPYVDFADYSERTHLLEVSGGIWKYKMTSTVLFEERSSSWIHFKVIRGHFLGLEGDLVFRGVLPVEKSFAKDKDLTVVFVRGLQLGSLWPPRFVMEKGAEIVFEFTARRMRSYIESNSSEPMEGSEEPTNDVNKKQG